MSAKKHILTFGLLLSCFSGYSQPTPPDPTDTPPPPPGLPTLPIDNWIWVLWIAAILLAGYFHMKTQKKNTI